MAHKTISLIIPCYNEEAVLPELFKRTTEAANAWNYDYEIICINDGSHDGTWNLLKEQNQKDPHWKAVTFSRNFGHQTAVSAGLFYASGDAVVIIDADLQDPPEVITGLISKWESGFDIVNAVRKKRKEGFSKRLSYWVFYRLMEKLVPFHIPLDSGDFSLMSRRVVNLMKSMPERNRFVRGLRAWTGFKQTDFEYERQARSAGEPKYDFKRLLRLAMDGITSFSAVPLSIASYLGLWVSVLSLAGILFTLAQRLFSTQFALWGIAPVPGYATTVISILFLGGVQLLCLGILGEYLGRIFDEVKQRPHWVISESAGLDIPAGTL
jgi:dolichol-phosphate mannosyltransferase